MDVPTPSCAAVTQSNKGYLFFEITFPISITGMILHAFAKTCVGKETNLSASYWNQLDIILDSEQAEYL